MRLLVLSDLHLGDGSGSDTYAGGAAAPDLLRRFAAPATEVLLNGDTVDFLGTGSALDLDPKRAAADATRIAAAPATAAFFAALGELLAAGGSATMRIGNHDVELALRDVQEVFRDALRQPPDVASRLLFRLGDEAMVREVGGTRILLAHGDQNDRWSKVDYLRLPGTDGTVPLQSGRFQHPPGSILVKRILGPLRRDRNMRFLHGLIPNFGVASIAALAVDLGALKDVFGKAQLDIQTQLMRNDAMPATFDDDEPDLGLGQLVADAGIEGADLDALEEALAEPAAGSAGRPSILAPAAGPAPLRTAAAPARAPEPTGLLAKLGARVLRTAIAPMASEARASRAEGSADRKEAERLARKFGASVVLMGHTHVAAWEQADDLLYVNTGSWTGVLALPGNEASESDWTDFLLALRSNPGLDPGLGGAALETRFHCAQIEPRAQGGARVSLLEWVPGAGPRVLRTAELEATAAAAQAAPMAVRGASAAEPGPELPALPHLDRAAERRQALLERSRAAYGYNCDTLLRTLPLASALPGADKPGRDWWEKVVQCFLRARTNNAAVASDAEASRREHLGLVHQANDLWTKLRSGSAIEAFASAVGPFLKEGHITGRPAMKKNYRDVYRILPEPEIASRHEFDSEFARMRLAGPNPMTLRRSSEPDDRFPVTEAQYQATIAGDTLEAARAEGRLFLADYAALDGVPGGRHASGAQKYVAAPLALFAVPPRGRPARSLMPIAIQCAQKPGPGVPVFTPRDGVAWSMAKTVVQSADCAVHQVTVHLANTHLVIERVALATRRQLAASHPLSVLLRPHFEGTFSINAFALSSLIPPGGNVERFMGPTLDSVHALATKSALEWDFGASVLPADLARRGVADRDLLPDYPYRDDALLVWQATLAWVGRYVDLYYRSEADVAADVELAAWTREMESPQGGRMRGIGRIETRDALVTAIAHVIFTASAQHAAVNFPMERVMSFAPAFPLAIYAPPPVSTTGLTEQDALDLLPPLDMAQLQIDVGYLLGALRHTQLGVYPRGPAFPDPDADRDPASLAQPSRSVYFADPRVRTPLQAFRSDLDRVEETILERNLTRPQYEFLQPSLIPQSINI